MWLSLSGAEGLFDAYRKGIRGHSYLKLLEKSPMHFSGNFYKIQIDNPRMTMLNDDEKHLLLRVFQCYTKRNAIFQY